jgi:multiple sugar transport system permease protein
MLLALGFALLLHQTIPLRGFFRTAMYFPSMVSGVAMSLLWYWIFNPQIGLFNYMLSWFGIHGPAWLMSPDTALYALIIMSFWTAGSGMILFLAGLQGVPSSLIEAARLDGAGRFRIFKNITLPMISPVLLFQLIMGLIDSFQVFTQAFVMTQGGPNYSTWFYVYNLYNTAFKEYRAGYSSALAWVLLIVVLVFTAIIMKLSNRYVHYEGGERR